MTFKWVPVAPEDARPAGFIAPALRAALYIATVPSRLIAGSRLDAIANYKDGQPKGSRAKKQDAFAIACLALLSFGYYMLFLPLLWWARALLLLFAWWRIVDVSATIMRTTVFEGALFVNGQRYSHSSNMQVVVLGLLS
jgi:hypothetical protein